MRILELLGGHILLETGPAGQTDPDDQQPGTSPPLAIIAAPGTAPIEPKITLIRLRPLHRLKHLDRGSLDGSV
jgi:hypothetical protein